jgi:hypothetical protein
MRRWEAVYTNGGQVVVKELFTIDTKTKAQTICTLPATSLGKMATAILIASAPDLLDACIVGRNAMAALMRSMEKSGHIMAVMNAFDEDNKDDEGNNKYYGFGVKMDKAIAKALCKA